MNMGIVGAGIMGRLLAFALVNAGHAVSLFDEGNDSGNMSCSMAAAGLLTPVSELGTSDYLIYQLGNEALTEHWPRIMDQLNKKIYFQNTGSFALAHPNDKADLVRFIHIINEKIVIKKTGIPIKKMMPLEFLELEPELEKFEEAYYFPDEAHIDSQAVLAALGDFFHHNPVQLHFNTHVDAIYPGEIHLNGTIKKFDLLVDCRGMGAKSIFTYLHGVRGELIWLHAEEVTIKRPIRFLHPRYSLYVVPRPEHVYLIGASEIHAENYSEISVRSALELLTAAYYLHSGFAEAKILKTVTQCRPTLPHYLPMIQYAEGLIAVNGLYRHGFLIAPTLVAEIMQWLQYGISFVRYAQLWEKFYDYSKIEYRSHAIK